MKRFLIMREKEEWDIVFLKKSGKVYDYQNDWHPADEEFYNTEKGAKIAAARYAKSNPEATYSVLELVEYDPFEVMKAEKIDSVRWQISMIPKSLDVSTTVFIFKDGRLMISYDCLTINRIFSAHGYTVL